MSAEIIPYSRTQTRELVDAKLVEHIEDVTHGTSPLEVTVINAAADHLLETNRNPHGLTVDDLEVYTRDQVDTLLAARSGLFDGGTIP